MDQSIHLLVTCVGGAMSPALINHLRSYSKFSLRIVGVNAGEAPVAKRVLDGFYKVPMGSDPTYVDEIKKIIEKEKIHFVIVGSDEEAFALSRVKQQVLADLDCHILVSEEEKLKLISSKLDTYQTLEGLGVKVPEYKVLNTNSELVTKLEELGYPDRSVVLKPVDGRGGRGVHVFVGNEDVPGWLGSGQRESRHEGLSLENIVELDAVMGKSLLMPMLKDPCYDVDLLSLEGNMLASVVRERVNPVGIPFLGNRFVDNEELEEYCKKVCRALDLNSLHDFDFMTDSQGNFSLLEINPRPSGSLAASLKAGVPLVDCAIDALRFGEHKPFKGNRTVGSVLPSLDLVTF